MRIGLITAAILLTALPAWAQTPAPTPAEAPVNGAYSALFAREKPLFDQPRSPDNDAAFRAIIPGYEALAAKGDTRAMFRLANIAQRLKDEASVFRWLRQMADLGDAEGQYYLASTLRRLPDCTEGRQWMLRSAEQGYEKAVSGMAFYYDQGTCGPKDAKRAAIWYEKAARLGMGVAQNNLGYMYRGGTGVRKNLIEAYAWFTLAGRQAYDPTDRAAQWDPEASRDLAWSVRQKFSEADLAKAEARIEQLCREDKVCSRVRN